MPTSNPVVFYTALGSLAACFVALMSIIGSSIKFGEIKKEVETNRSEVDELRRESATHIDVTSCHACHDDTRKTSVVLFEKLELMEAKRDIAREERQAEFHAMTAALHDVSATVGQLSTKIDAQEQMMKINQGFTQQMIVALKESCIKDYGILDDKIQRIKNKLEM